MTDTPNPITEENIETLRRMSEYLALALKNGDQAVIKSGYQIEISFYRPTKKVNK